MQHTKALKILLTSKVSNYSLAYIWFSGFRAIIVEAHEYCKGGKSWTGLWYTCFVSVLKYVHRLGHVLIFFYFSNLSLKLHVSSGVKEKYFYSKVGAIFLKNISKLWYRPTKNCWNLLKFWFPEEDMFFSKNFLIWTLTSISDVFDLQETDNFEYFNWSAQLKKMRFKDLLENLHEKSISYWLSRFFY